MNCTVSTVCGRPSSSTSNSSLLRSSIGSSSRPVTETSTRTSSTLARNVGCCGAGCSAGGGCCGDAGCCGGADCCAPDNPPAAHTTSTAARRARDRNGGGKRRELQIGTGYYLRQARQVDCTSRRCAAQSHRHSRRLSPRRPAARLCGASARIHRAPVILGSIVSSSWEKRPRILCRGSILRRCGHAARLSCSDESRCAHHKPTLPRTESISLLGLNPTPCRNTVSTLRMSPIVADGSPLSTTRSACLPFAIEPMRASRPR